MTSICSPARKANSIGDNLSSNLFTSQRFDSLKIDPFNITFIIILLLFLFFRKIIYKMIYVFVYIHKSIWNINILKG